MLIWPSTIALLSTSALVLAGCADTPAAPPAADATPAVATQFIRLNPPKLRLHRPDRCKLARVDLKADRVTELFQQFHAEQAGADADVAAAPAASPPCQPRAR